MQFEIEFESDFDSDLLARFAKDHGVTYSIGFDEGYTATFRSDNRDRLEKLRERLHRIAIGRGIYMRGMIEDIHEDLRSTNWTGGVYTG